MALLAVGGRVDLLLELRHPVLVHRPLGPPVLATRLATKALFGYYDYQSPQYLNYYAGDGEQLAALRRLTRDDVNRAARKYLDPANIVIAVAGPLGVIQSNATEEERPLVAGGRR